MPKYASKLYSRLISHIVDGSEDNETKEVEIYKYCNLNRTFLKVFKIKVIVMLAMLVFWNYK